MDTSTPSLQNEERVCATCGAWVHREREHCPWCNAPVPRSDEPEPLSAPARTTSDPAAAPPSEVDETATLIPVEAGRGTVADGLPAARGRRFWLRSFSLSFLLVLLALVGFVGAGVYQGLNDRQVAERQAAIKAFETGQTMLEAGRYELALAYFREALRLEPNFEAATQLMAVAQRGATGGSDQVAPTAGPNPINDHDHLFAEGIAALEREEWEMAAATFDALSSQAPTFRAEEVAEGLFQARMQAGRAALEDERLDDALRQLDQALAVRPEDEEALALRRLVATYRNGLRAFQDEAWERAADQLRAVYLINPDFLDSAELLARAHLELGRAFEARDIWCQAAQQYRASLSVAENARVAQLAETSERQCNLRVAVPPTPPRRPTDEADEPPFDPTEAITGTEGVSDILPSPLPFASATPSLPTATPVPLEFLYILSGEVGASFDESCGGHYVRGRVTAPDGTPLPDITVMLVDEFGNRVTAATKRDPLGEYNFPISANPIRYQVMIVTGSLVISPAIPIEHTGQFADSPLACHILNWQQVPG